MKKLLKKIFAATFLLLVFNTINSAQTPPPQVNYKGKYKFLKGLTKLNVQYDYDNMSINSFDNEQDLLETEIVKRNAIKPESGNEWAKRWIMNRETRNEPNFETYFNSVLAKKGMSVGDFPDAAFTIVVRTIRIVPEDIIGFDRNNFGDLILPPLYNKISSIDIEILFVPTNDLQNVLSKMTINNIYAEDGYGNDYGDGVTYRLERAYGYCGTSSAKFLKKNKFFKP